jgi:CubicO group peptidase (beta-lactamase class C family)
VWQGNSILPKGWVKMTTTDSVTNGLNRYGAHFWLKAPYPYRFDDQSSIMADDAFHATGHDGQFITIVPSYDLVVVRMGLSRGTKVWDHVGFINALLAVLPSN